MTLCMTNSEQNNMQNKPQATGAVSDTSFCTSTHSPIATVSRRIIERVT